MPTRFIAHIGPTTIWSFGLVAVLALAGCLDSLGRGEHFENEGPDSPVDQCAVLANSPHVPPGYVLNVSEASWRENTTFLEREVDRHIQFFMDHNASFHLLGPCAEVRPDVEWLLSLYEADSDATATPSPGGRLHFYAFDVTVGNGTVRLAVDVDRYGA